MTRYASNSLDVPRRVNGERAAARALVRASHQQGVAVIAALLVVAAAAIIAAGMMARQSTQVRLLQAELHRVQARALLLGGIDWARITLRHDERNSTITHREQAWATPINDLQVSQEGDVRQAWFSGRIEDEQGKFNLTNLARNGLPVPEQVEALTRLLTSLRIAEDSAPAIAQRIARSQARREPGPRDAGNQSGQSNTPGASGSSDAPGSTVDIGPSGADTAGPARALGWQSLDDLREIEGIGHHDIDALRPYLTVLPRSTPLNVNTTTVEVLATLSPELSLSAAASIMNQRAQGNYFTNLGDFNNKLRSVVPDIELDNAQITTQSKWFGVVGTVRIEPAVVDMRALILRGDNPTPSTVWMQEAF
ncbi:MAG: type II secretion system minor pseudopilin GspK [Burkholderiaceae bacterium]|nr:type II secretion system minor pseudopilin GspK [Burkholderiaceae bacterium]